MCNKTAIMHGKSGSNPDLHRIGIHVQVLYHALVVHTADGSSMLCKLSRCRTLDTMEDVGKGGIYEAQTLQMLQ